MIKEEKAKEILLEILSHHTGINARISRGDLCRTLNGQLRVIMGIGNKIPDRKMRILIAELRTTTTAGAMICSSTDGGGYFMAADLVELKKFLDIERRRGKTIIDQVNLQERHAQQIEAGKQGVMI